MLRETTYERFDCLQISLHGVSVLKVKASALDFSSKTTCRCEAGEKSPVFGIFSQTSSQ